MQLLLNIVLWKHFEVGWGGVHMVKVSSSVTYSTVIGEGNTACEKEITSIHLIELSQIIKIYLLEHDVTGSGLGIHANSIWQP